ncbi:MAG: ATP synthase subunit I [Deltaproteobacteria bacterium]|nr:ATP synthase subunit I [Deltaproteobacteria bacterium]
MSQASQNETGELAKSLTKKTLVLTVAVAAALYLVGQAAWARGVGLGGLASVINILVMAKLLHRVFTPGADRNMGWQLASQGIRFGVMAAALGVALVFPARFTPLATAAGLFAVQITIYLDRFLLSRLATAHNLGSR